MDWLNWQCCLAGSSKTAPRILIFSMTMGADYSIELIFNETCAPQFNGHNNSFLASVWGIRHMKKHRHREIHACVLLSFSSPDSSWLFLCHEVYYSRSWDPWARFSWRFCERDKKRKEGRPRKLPGLFPDWETLDMRSMKAVTMLSIDYSYSNRSLTVGIPLQLAG